MPENSKLMPAYELEQEIMEFVFSDRCKNHRECLAVWDKNPWIAVSMYEVEHYPENLQYQLAFPKEVEIPRYVLRLLENEEMWLMKGQPVYISYPRAQPMIIEEDGFQGEVNKFGRLILNYDERSEEDY